MSSPLPPLAARACLSALFRMLLFRRLTSRCAPLRLARFSADLIFAIIVRYPSKKERIIREKCRKFNCRRQKDRRQEAGGRRQEAGSRRQEAGSRRQEAGVRQEQHHSSLVNGDRQNQQKVK